jgi:hypothetical protein
MSDPAHCNLMPLSVLPSPQTQSEEYKRKTLMNVICPRQIYKGKVAQYYLEAMGQIHAPAALPNG